MDTLSLLNGIVIPPVNVFSVHERVGPSKTEAQVLNRKSSLHIFVVGPSKCLFSEKLSLVDRSTQC